MYAIMFIYRLKFKAENLQLSLSICDTEWYARDSSFIDAFTWNEHLAKQKNERNFVFSLAYKSWFLLTQRWIADG